MVYKHVPGSGSVKKIPQGGMKIEKSLSQNDGLNQNQIISLPKDVQVATQ